MKTYEKLENLINESQSISNLRGNNRIIVERLLNYGKAYTVTVRGTGYRRFNDDRTFQIECILSRLGIAYVRGNDAPRGGAIGTYIEITSRAFLREMRSRNNNNQ